MSNSNIKTLDLSTLSNMPDHFLSGCRLLKNINLTHLSRVKNIGYSFLRNSSVKEIDLDPLMSIEYIDGYFWFIVILK
jgi:hypothetical protein